MGSVNTMSDYQTFIDDMTSDANEVRQSILANPTKYNIERQIDDFVNYYAHEYDAPFAVSEAKLRAVFHEFRSAIARAELNLITQLQDCGRHEEVAA